MSKLRNIKWNQVSIEKARFFLAPILACSLLLFPSIFTSHVLTKQLPMDGISSTIKGGSPILSKEPELLSLNQLAFTKVADSPFQFAVTSVYSPSSSRIHQSKIPVNSWREFIKNWFRPPTIEWSFTDIKIERLQITEAKDLRLPAEVIEKLETADQEQKDRERQMVTQSMSEPSDSPIPLQCFKYPIKSKHLSPYGSPRTLPNGIQYYHLGLDMRAWEKTPIYAMGEGRVVLSEEMIVPGKNIILDHGGGLYSRYMHFSNLEKKSGDIVKKSERIGLSGSTGRSQAPHLHFEVIWKGNHASPQSFLQMWEQICDPA